jgi:putative membrane protein
LPTLADLLFPWNFSPTVLVAVIIAAVLYARGAGRDVLSSSGTESSGQGASLSPTSTGRRLAFGLGLALIYAALQTYWDYYASHMLFVLQLQHFALHDLAPALIAWAAPRAVFARGLPPFVRRLLRGMTPALRKPARVILNPWIAAIMYVAALLIWLWPPLTFAVMLSNALYKLMSWSVLAGALPFWFVMLDPRPYPQARARPGQRIVMLHVAMTAIVLTGAMLTLSTRDWYPVYAVCGRFLPITAVADQQLGGVVMWVLGALLFVPVFFIVIGRNLEQEEAAARRAATKRQVIAGAATPSLAKRMPSQ